MSSKKTYREPLAEEWASALLVGASASNSSMSIWTRVQQARVELKAARTEALAALKSSPLANMAAEGAAKKSGRRGTPSLDISPEGIVELVVSYKGQASKRNPQDAGRRGWESTLPSLGELRETAMKLGIDPESYGRRKRELAAAIQVRGETDLVGIIDEAQANEIFAPAAPMPKQKMSKTAPAVGAVTVVQAVSNPTIKKPNGALSLIAAKGESLDLSKIDDDDLDLDALLANS